MTASTVGCGAFLEGPWRAGAGSLPSTAPAGWPCRSTLPECTVVMPWLMARSTPPSGMSPTKSGEYPNPLNTAYRLRNQVTGDHSARGGMIGKFAHLLPIKGVRLP